MIQARITAVVDGDTIKVRADSARRRNYTVRLLGIDTPETVDPGEPVECGGPESTAYMLRLAFTRPTDEDGDGVLDTKGGSGRRVTLVTDPTQATFDRYRRLLAYVTTRAGVELERRMLRSGWAKVYVFNKAFRRLSTYRAIERSARRADRGVWGHCGGDFHRPQ